MTQQNDNVYANAIPAYLLMRELSGTVPIFGNKKVRIGFFGSGAFVNFQQGYVNIPALPQSKMVPNRIAMELRGYAMHEAAHLLFTDSDVLEFGRTEEEKKDMLLHHTWNAIEDYFIDRNFMTVYPGYRKNNDVLFARTAEQYLQESWPKNPDSAKDLRIIGPVALTWCRSIYFGHITDAPKRALDTLPQALRDRVWGYFWDTEMVSSTQDCLDLARIIVNDIRQNPFDPNNLPQNQQQQQQQQGSRQSQGGSGQQGQGQGKGSGGMGAKGGQTNQQHSGQQQEPTPIDTNNSIDEILKDLGDLSDAQKETDIVTPMWSDKEAEDSNTNTILREEQGYSNYNRIRNNISGTIGQISKVLRRDLKTLTRVRWKGGRSDGILDSKNLHRIFNGNNDIYKRKTQNKSIDTALTLLIDCSGSMDGERIALCQEMAIALEAALHDTPVKTEIIGYTSCSIDEDTMPDDIKAKKEALEQKGESFNLYGTQMIVFKGFNDHRSKLTVTLGNMHEVGMGGTPTGDAISLAGARLLQRKEKRHIMFVLTDGSPDDIERCQESVKALEDCGVVVFGFGIGADAVKHCFNRHAMISEIRELGAIVMSTLSKELIGTAGQRVHSKKLVLPAHIHV